MYRGQQMNIHSIAKQKLQTISKESLVKEMGYNSTKKGLQTLDKFLESATLSDWLLSGYYDFKYTAEDFFKKFCDVLKLDEVLVKEQLKNEKKIIDEKKSFSRCYIYINTNFKRTTEPIFALAMMESARRIKPNAEKFLFKSDKEVFAIVSDIVKTNYKETGGELKMWGKIVNYVYHHKDGKSYVFNVNGDLMAGAKVCESFAVIRV